MKRTSATVAIILMMACGVASGREASGKIGFIGNPISTRPAFAMIGEKVYVDLTQGAFDGCDDEMEIFLKTDGARIPVNYVERIAAATVTYSFSIELPVDAQPGLYDLTVKKCGYADVSNRAVMVLAKYPEEYTIMHVTDIHIGRMADGLPIGKMYYEKIAAKANKLKPDMVIITGDITDFSDPEQFRTFLEITDGIAAPTVVIAGNHDRENRDADEYLGPNRFTFNYGAHFFLAFDTQYHIPSPDPEGNIEWMRREMRARKEAPFKVMFSHREDSDFRLIIPKVIIPYKVDLFLSGHYHEGGDVMIGGLPSRYLITRAALEGYYRTIRVAGSDVTDVRTSNVDE